LIFIYQIFAFLPLSRKGSKLQEEIMIRFLPQRLKGAKEARRKAEQSKCCRMERRKFDAQLKRP
jgi:hypothetical protein